MRSLITYTLSALLLSLASTSLATPASNNPRFLAKSGVSEAVRRHVAPSPTVFERNEWTNAERLARGLPLKKPTPRRSGVSARQASPLPSTTYTGVIQVFDVASLDVPIGYVSEDSENRRILKHRPLLVDAVRVSFNLETGATAGTDIQITMLNSDFTQDFLLGLVQGVQAVDNVMGPASDSHDISYFYVAGVRAPGSLPGAVPAVIPNSYTTMTGIQRSAISDVWSISLDTGVLTPAWVNPDGTKPAVDFFSAGVTAELYGGDQATFLVQFPLEVPNFQVAFKFIPDVVAL
ncbi:hypothetical protein B0H34DRAFT_679237 [Crassisporium funariophilum]|nr:hypothetical protein B0H34DRAFT_679237 [Crassisporium funariophilum]